jgi:hypothetical protein
VFLRGLQHKINSSVVCANMFHRYAWSVYHLLILSPTRKLTAPYFWEFSNKREGCTAFVIELSLLKCCFDSIMEEISWLIIQSGLFREGIGWFQSIVEIALATNTKLALAGFMFPYFVAANIICTKLGRVEEGEEGSPLNLVERYGKNTNCSGNNWHFYL